MLNRLSLLKIVSLALLAVFTLVPVAWAEGFPAASADRMEARIKALSKFGANADGGVDRVAYSKADIEGRAYIARLMEGLGLKVRIDAGGNIIGRREGSDPALPPIMFGSHTDSVPGGGNYDGDVGVISALEVIDLLNAAGHTTRHPLEVVDFSNEEGGLVGSLVLTGALKPSALDVISHSGLSIGDGINAIGGDVKRLAEAVVKPGRLKAFIELHIEQGAVLDEAGIEIGVVEGIVGIRWWDVTIDGFANHAGTTPMNRRRDAMVAAARLTLVINEVALSLPGRQVATVGRIRAEPGAPNVIPGRV
ncbi:MAG: Zn-dependent hydrolase, partial [Sphingomonadales bacterium]